jgi:AAA+ ATPase superfamily predicted ATPase
LAKQNNFHLAKSLHFQYIWPNKTMELIGRDREKAYLNQKFKSDKAELIAIIGRRRVGKTFFVKETMKNQLFFQFTGLYKSTLGEHMERFARALTSSFHKELSIRPPISWFAAFDMLRNQIELAGRRKRKVIFFDELPWMATNKSRFVTAFTDFWNSWASHRSDLLVIICGSSASWMINKILKNKGGLYNRVTGRIHLHPFSLHEMEIFLKAKGIVANKKSMIDLYMVLGGIPYYLDHMNKGESVTQAIDRICFSKSAIMKEEYSELFASLFDSPESHKNIVETLSEHPKGLDRNELLKNVKAVSGGGFTRVLDELEQSAFISSYTNLGHKSKGKLFKLRDPFTLFYLKYMNNAKPGNTGAWIKLSKSPSWSSWSGLAYENICHIHEEQIKKALKIDGIISISSAWHHKGNDEMHRAQIDLLFDRADSVINLCEIKYSNDAYVITADYAEKLRKKIAAFRYFTQSKKAIFPTIITTYDLIENKHSIDFIQNVVTMDALFEA